MKASIMDAKEHYFNEFNNHMDISLACRDGIFEMFDEMLKAWQSAIQKGGKIIFFGNGGSAADAQHLATELVVRFEKNRAPIPSIALTTDTSILTAGGNDLGFENIFARQIHALGCEEDLAVGISTSGNSLNVIKGLQKAQEMGLATAAFTGGDGGKLKDFIDPLIIVPSRSVARIQEIHILLGHILCGYIEQQMPESESVL